MAFRSLTQQFEEYRSDFRRASGIKRRPNPALLPPGALTSDTNLEVAPLPPAWVEYKEALQRNLVEIRGLLKKLQALYNARLKVTFNEEQSAKQQREIDIITSEISKQFHAAEFNLKKVAVAGTDTSTALSFQERSTRVNVMKAAAKELQDLSKAYRAQQKDFAVRIKGQEEFGLDVMGAEDRVNVTDLIDRDSLSAEAQAQLNVLAERGSQREKEIAKLVTSINELSQLFRQLNSLVVEQGTIVDRIDYNIERALNAVQEGNKVLKKTEKETRTPKMLICIVALVLVVIILLIIVVSKYS